MLMFSFIRRYVLTGKLWVVMGAGWVSELLSTIVTQPLWLWTIVDLFNELQGVFIFLILVVKPKLYYLIRKRLGKKLSYYIQHLLNKGIFINQKENSSANADIYGQRKLRYFRSPMASCSFDTLSIKK